MRNMKLSLLWMFAVLLFFCEYSFAGDGTFTRNAQKYSNPGLRLRFTCTVDSLDTLTSNTFDLEKFQNANWGAATDTAQVGQLPFKVQYQATSTLGAPRLTAYVQASMDGTNWFNVDTLFSDFTSESITRADLDLNNQKYPYYRLLIYGITGSPPNRSDTIFDLYFYAYQREN